MADIGEFMICYNAKLMIVWKEMEIKDVLDGQSALQLLSHVRGASE